MKVNSISLLLLNRVLDISKTKSVIIVATKEDVFIVGENPKFQVKAMNNTVDTDGIGKLEISKDIVKLFDKNSFIDVSDECISNEKRTVKGDFTCKAEPLEIEFKDNLVIMDKDDFNSITDILYATAEDDTRPILQGIHFNISNDCIETCALDGYRLAIRKNDFIATDVNTEFTIHSDVIEAFRKIKSEHNIKIYTNGDYVKLECWGTSIISKLLEGKFVNYKALVPTEFKTRIKINTSDLLQLVKSYKTRVIKFSIKSDEMLIKGDIEKVKKVNGKYLYETVASIEDKLECKWQGEPIKIAFNPRYLIDALKDKKEEAEIKFTSPISPMVIEQQDGKTELILPIRINKEG